MSDVDHASRAEQLRLGARARAERLGFTMSSDDDTGRLLSVLAVAAPAGGRILEIGTGVGAGTAAIVAGLGGRGDVRLVTVEANEATAAATRDDEWPSYVEFAVGDAVELLPSLGQFDLIFADAPGEKTSRLDLTIAALKPTGELLVDDMAAWENGDPAVSEWQNRVRQELLGHQELEACELNWSTGLILCARRE